MFTKTEKTSSFAENKDFAPLRKALEKFRDRVRLVSSKEKRTILEGLYNQLCGYIDDYESNNEKIDDKLVKNCLEANFLCDVIFLLVRIPVKDIVTLGTDSNILTAGAKFTMYGATVAASIVAGSAVGGPALGIFSGIALGHTLGKTIGNLKQTKSINAIFALFNSLKDTLKNTAQTHNLNLSDDENASPEIIWEGEAREVASLSWKPALSLTYNAETYEINGVFLYHHDKFPLKASIYLCSEEIKGIITCKTQKKPIPPSIEMTLKMACIRSLNQKIVTDHLDELAAKIATTTTAP